MVASVQISMSSWRRSSSVIRPRSYCLSILAARSSYTARISGLSAGVLTSPMETVTPGPGGPVEAEVLQRVEAVCATSTLG